jgi:hypothetical protein
MTNITPVALTNERVIFGTKESLTLLVIIVFHWDQAPQQGALFIDVGRSGDSSHLS